MLHSQATQDNCTSTARPSSSSRGRLLKLLEEGSDVQLIFTAADKTTVTVPAHSFILKKWSTVLAEALNIGSYSSSKSSTTERSDNADSVIYGSIPLDGSDKEGWLLAMELVYPVVPPIEMNWDSLEVLLHIADKYGMVALLRHLGNFIAINMKHLSYTPDSNQLV